jgi:hypothetical protein
LPGGFQSLHKAGLKIELGVKVGDINSYATGVSVAYVDAKSATQSSC